MFRIALTAAIALTASCGASCDVFTEWAAMDPDYEFEPAVWDGPNGLAEFRYRGQLAGWYLVEMHGDRINWMVRTDRDRSGHHVMEIAQGADAVTTVAGLAMGFAEANPAGAGGAAALKIVGIAAVKSLPASQCYASVELPVSVGWGAAAWNVGVIAGLGPGAVIPALVAMTMSGPDHNERFWACAPEVR